jgi:hypothetical protein
MIRYLMAALVALALMSCTESTYTVQRMLIGADCRPEHLQTNGHCTPTH